MRLNKGAWKEKKICLERQIRVKNQPIYIKTLENEIQSERHHLSLITILDNDISVKIKHKNPQLTVLKHLLAGRLSIPKKKHFQTYLLVLPTMLDINS